MTFLRPMLCHRRTLLGMIVAVVAGMAPAADALAPQGNSNEELLTLSSEAGRPGGRLVTSLRAEPKTLNPVVATDAPSREVIGAMHADMVHINRATQLTESALAK